MFIVGLFSWWYGDGWRQRFEMVKERLAVIIDYFSIDLLLKTIFAPYRQISAGRVDGPLDVMWHAFVDQLISRCIGMILRTAVILLGVVTILVVGLIYMVVLVLWGVAPILPVAGIVMMIIGWTPL